MPRIKPAPFLFRDSTPRFLPESFNIRHHHGVANFTICPEQKITLTSISAEFIKLAGMKAPLPIGETIQNISCWNDKGQLEAAVLECFNDQSTQSLTWVLDQENGEPALTMHCSVVPAFGHSGTLDTIIVIVNSNAADEAFANHLKGLNFYDELTGLPNKNYLLKVLNEEHSQSSFSDQVAILLINILQFQRVNESFGYEFGDKILKKIAMKLETCLPQLAFLSRFDADKFSILVRDEDISAVLTDAEALAQFIHHEMKQPILVDGQHIHLELSIGIAVGLSAQKDANLLLQQAHIAMRRQKRTSQNRTLVYQPDLQTRASSRLLLENELRDALKNKELSLHYQPIISMQNGSLLGFEALCRWEHKERGQISPIEFIPLAEESGLIVPLGHWALREACTSLKNWIEKYPHFSNLIMNVNVSSLQLLQDNFATSVNEILLNAGIKGSQLKLEITETTLIENAELVRDVLLDLKTLDISLAIDDFGTGYSSLSYLNQFPIDTLKIDKSFVNHMNSSEDSYKIIHVISTLAHTLGMTLVAEGIEEEEQMTALQKLGCHTGQGYLFSKPLANDAAEEYIRKEGPPLV
ncbi:putative bifunctional diguanylate cyclase/phosphodiesterase [Paremcibacter congregatus]|uniref:GGDEF domain-containing response regulator n=1 Tax=Paremcibacter congregatus TaxID=2043170 RepID=A0A2G4YNB5_9PROT|nr:bifunctional diguanylate cyclase/phosphodiesterase [Paremcibacter congregatus]PHZ83785.1 GGDEF domain-containing response regulator [Paremcibacter congregatus]QDE27489.1 bifunctional diguanylate cyclase/phosphodiesterase [Paremcibacter congregatus]